MTTTLEFTVEGPPQPYQRPGGKRRYTPKRTRDYLQRVGWAAREALGRMSWRRDRTYDVRVMFYMQDNKRRDVDNMVKSICDGATGILWDDDSQITGKQAWKAVGRHRPRAEVRVRMIDG